MKRIRNQVAKTSAKIKVNSPPKIKQNRKNILYFFISLIDITLMLTDINIYLKNFKTHNFWRNNFLLEKIVLTKSFLDFKSDPELDSDPLFHETDPRIWIRLNMKRIWNTGKNCYGNMCFSYKIFLHLCRKLFSNRNYAICLYLGFFILFLKK